MKSIMLIFVAIGVFACKTSNVEDDATTKAVSDSYDVDCKGILLWQKCKKFSSVSFAVRFENGYCFYARKNGSALFQIPEGAKTHLSLTRNQIGSKDRSIWRSYPNGRPGNDQEGWLKLGHIREYLLAEADSADKTAPGTASLKELKPYSPIGFGFDYILQTEMVLENIAYFLDVPQGAKPCPKPNAIKIIE